MDTPAEARQGAFANEILESIMNHINDRPTLFNFRMVTRDCMKQHLSDITITLSSLTLSPHGFVLTSIGMQLKTGVWS